ncbi:MULTISPECIES: carbohydrate ABC transporter permease [Mammaliicoccus]|uniref:Maltose/maltodextrin transport system permease protein n=1 Tax=Mammaliicoccus fleurettii TaxID=150056 RepID=A0ABS5MRB1_9STAP|nr:sugar ABC transporter permease [Mammaliicoccus fleurettii]MBL0848390.1 sugar ABC transporter permease [Mammaliicoccus fleurettii]MBO3061847.1 sugar ABC transporter permease [Mammaliicoccus fleurettii]MBS3673152.1 sugar ABC transporter permease [Mammaliicoccus fleurettii]MBS3698207.1 sugar ABC transporter permease [Mammaliicoccus fleurettii]MBW0765066.1 sugar ABC transporter permease [Mammaliicoccus fleurettii]
MKMRNPKLAAILSIIPGIGQFYNKRYIKGSIFIIFFISFMSVFYQFMNIGFWGLFTLGTVPKLDDSRVLLAQGIISLLLIAFATTLYVVNLIDAYRNADQYNKGFEIKNSKGRMTATWDKTFPYLLISPGIFLLIFVVVFPLLFMCFLAFTNYNLYNAPPRHLLEWVGFDNFKSLVTVPIWKTTFFSVLTWTIVWTLVATTLQIALALLLAIIVNHPLIRFKKLIRTVLILPWAVPSFVTILIFAAIFNDDFGSINNDILQPLFGFAPAWLNDPFWAKIAIILIQVWLGFPFVFALFTGVLQSISSDWYEAADMDGASSWQKFRNITFPHILFATAPLLIMQYAGNFNNFNLIYLFNKGGPPVSGQNAGSTDILISWVYRLTFDMQNYNMAATISLIIGVFIAIIAFLQFRKTSTFKDEGDI